MISICMASYNGELFIREQLDSIQKQTVQDFELIITDDCSTDNTFSVVQEYAAKDSRIHAYRNKNNLGFCKNFEKAISYSTGELIALADQDDIWLPEHLEILQKIIGNHDMACGNELLFENGKPAESGYNLFQAENITSGTGGIESLYRLLCIGCGWGGNSMMIRRALLQRNKVLPIMAHYHDAWFSATSSLYGGHICTDQVLTCRRIHSNNASAVTFGNCFSAKIRNFFWNGQRRCLNNQISSQMTDELLKFAPSADAQKVLSESKKILDGYCSCSVVKKISGFILYMEKCRPFLAGKNFPVRLGRYICYFFDSLLTKLSGVHYDT